jgi:hypothetical protein
MAIMAVFRFGYTAITYRHQSMFFVLARQPNLRIEKGR